VTLKNEKEKCNMKRKSWDEYFMDFARLASDRSVCNKMHVGAILVRDNRILGTGYNGPSSGLAHCEEGKCDADSRPDKHCIKAVHAELNAVIHCALHGVSTKGSTLYTTNFPCSQCALMIINAGIVHVVYEKDYNDNRVNQYQFLSRVGVTYKQL
jgi:dCMP deaminase